MTPWSHQLHLSICSTPDSFPETTPSRICQAQHWLPELWYGLYQLHSISPLYDHRGTPITQQQTPRQENYKCKCHLQKEKLLNSLFGALQHMLCCMEGGAYCSFLWQWHKHKLWMSFYICLFYSLNVSVLNESMIISKRGLQSFSTFAFFVLVWFLFFLVLGLT